MNDNDKKALELAREYFTEKHRLETKDHRGPDDDLRALKLEYILTKWAVDEQEVVQSALEYSLSRSRDFGHIFNRVVAHTNIMKQAFEQAFVGGHLYQMVPPSTPTALPLEHQWQPSKHNNKRSKSQ